MDPNEASEMVTGLVETTGNLIIEYGLSVIGAIVSKIDTTALRSTGSEQVTAS